jgi:hypothetical protein
VCYLGSQPLEFVVRLSRFGGERNPFYTEAEARLMTRMVDHIMDDVAMLEEECCI